MNNLSRGFRGGFTILELAITLFIVASLMSVATMTARHVHNKAFMGVLQSDMRSIKDAAGRFKVDCGVYPPMWRAVSIPAWPTSRVGKRRPQRRWKPWICLAGEDRILEMEKQSWGVLYEWDNYSQQLPGNGKRNRRLPDRQTGKLGRGRWFPNQEFEDYLEETGVDCSLMRGVIAIRMGSGDEAAAESDRLKSGRERAAVRRSLSLHFLQEHGDKSPLVDSPPGESYVLHP
jgi:prepilin-type N-terminal cleavage/methylation domain-containing protein